jgi:hypothetical protein
MPFLAVDMYPEYRIKNLSGLPGWASALCRSFLWEEMGNARPVFVRKRNIHRRFKYNVIGIPHAICRLNS